MIACWSSRGDIIASYRKDGVLSTRTIGKAEYTAYHPEKEFLLNAGAIDVRPDFPGWYRGVFHDYDSRKLALTNNPSLYEADVSPVRRFMSDHACKLEAPLRSFADIETDSRGKIDDTILGLKRILAITCLGEDKVEFRQVLEADTDDAEVNLLREFWEFVAGYDQIVAWNGDKFDFPVLKERTKRLMPRFNIGGRLMFLDQLAAFERFNQASESGEEKTSMALQAVSMALLGEGKNDFNARKTWDAWVAGGVERQRMLDYCAQDTALLAKVEVKTGHLALFQTLCQWTTALPNSHGLKPTAQYDAVMLRRAHLRKTHLSSKLDGRVTEKFDGAYVMMPETKGIERDVHVADFAGLYPSIMRSFNMGSDTKGLPGCSVPGTDITFSTEKESLLCEVIREAVEIRVESKNRKKSLPPGSELWIEAGRKDASIKTFVLSGYGVQGSQYSRFFDFDLARSIPLIGQWLIKAVKTAAVARGYRVIYGDTDSVFVTGCSREEFAKFVAWCNSELFPKMLEEQCTRPEHRCVKLDFEKSFDRIVFPLGNVGQSVAKRYAGRYAYYAGIAATAGAKPEIKGLEYMRGDAIRIATRLQHECITKLLAGEEDPEVFESWIREQRTRFFDREVALEDIVVTKGISRKLDDYKSIGPHVRVARELEALGEDVSEGTRIAYVVMDGSVSPSVVISADQFDGVTFDRHHYWMSAIYPPTMRVLAGAFPDHPWSRWIGKRPKAALPGQMTLGLT